MIEGSEDREEWREYHFLFKPSVSSRIPQIVGRWCGGAGVVVIGGGGRKRGGDSDG